MIKPFYLIILIFLCACAESVTENEDKKNTITDRYHDSLAINPPSEKLITQKGLMEENAISFMNNLKSSKQLNSFFGNNWTLVYHLDNRCSGSTDGTIANLSPLQIDKEIKLQVTNDGQGWACDTVASTTYEMSFNLSQLVQDWDRFTIEDYESPEKNCLYIEGKGASDYLKLYYNNEQHIIKLEYRSEDPG